MPSRLGKRKLQNCNFLNPECLLQSVTSQLLSNLVMYIIYTDTNLGNLCTSLNVLLPSECNGECNGYMMDCYQFMLYFMTMKNVYIYIIENRDICLKTSYMQSDFSQFSFRLFLTFLFIMVLYSLLTVWGNMK